MRASPARDISNGRFTAAPTLHCRTSFIPKRCWEVGSARDRDGGQCPGRIPAWHLVFGTVEWRL